jgi:hypothetical protein
MTTAAHLDAPPGDVLRKLVDPKATSLSTWQFHGYVPDPCWQRPTRTSGTGCMRHKVERVFSRNGSVLVFEQWDMAADGASIAGSPPATLKVGRYLASAGGMRSPSGCVSASLAWDGDGTQYSLRVVGPLALEAQRELLLETASSIEAAASRRVP